MEHHNRGIRRGDVSKFVFGEDLERLQNNLGRYKIEPYLRKNDVKKAEWEEMMNGYQRIV